MDQSSSSPKGSTKWEEMSRDQLVDFVKKLLLIQKKLKLQVKEYESASTQECKSEQSSQSGAETRSEIACQTTEETPQDGIENPNVVGKLQTAEDTLHEKAALDEKVKQLSDQLQAAKQEIAQKAMAIMELEDYRNLVQDLHNQIKSLRIQLEKQTETVTSVNGRCQSLVEERDSLSDKKNEYKSRNEKLNEELKQARMDNAHLKDQMQECSNRDEKSLQHILELTNEISQLKHKLEDVEAKAKEERANWNEQIAERCSRITELEDSLERRISEMNEIKATFDNTVQEHANYKKKVAEALRKSSNESTSDELKYSQEKMVTLKQKLEQSENQLMDLQKELAISSVKANQQQIKIAQLKETIAIQNQSFQKEIQELKNNFASGENKLKEEIHRFKCDNVQLKNRNQELLDNSQKLLVEMSDKETMLYSLQYELNATAARAEEMACKSERLEKALEILRENSKAKLNLNRDDDSKSSSQMPSTQLGIILTGDYSKPPTKVLFSDNETGNTKDIAEIEAENLLLKELTMTLKLELSRFDANEKRRLLLENGEYLKNVLFKFLSTNDKDERTTLVPVLARLLVLNEDETEQLKTSLLGSWWNRR